MLERKHRTRRFARFVLAFTMLVLVPAGALAQVAGRDTPAHRKYSELPDDEYIKTARAEQGTSPAYRSFSADIFTVQVNVNVLGENLVGDAANEPSLAIDPANPNRMAIGWRQFDTVVSNFRQAGYGFTEDGGTTWKFPGVIEPGIFRSDPVLDSDAEGNFFTTVSPSTALISLAMSSNRATVE